MRLVFQKVQFKEALVIEFCMMFTRVLCEQQKKKKILVVDSFPGFVSDFSMSFDKFQNCSKLFPFYSLVKGISGETHGQIFNLWICGFEPIVIVLLIGPGQDVCVRLYYNNNSRQSTCVYLTEFMFYCLKEIRLVIAFYMET